MNGDMVYPGPNPATNPSESVALPPGIAGGPNVGTQPQNQQIPGLAPDYGYGDYAKALKNIPASPTLAQTPYKKPNTTGEIIAGALNLLFPGSQISKIAAGYAGGAEQGAEKNYDRANQENQQKYQAAENTRNDAVQGAQLAGQQYDAQLRAAQQYENEQERVANDKARQTEADANTAVRKEAEEATTRTRDEANRIRLRQIAEEHFKNVQTVETSRENYALKVKQFGLNEDKFNQSVRRDNSRVAMFLTGRQMSANTAQQRMGLTAKLATFREFAQDRRNANDQLVKMALAKTTQTRLQAEHAIAIEAKNASDDDATKQQKIGVLQDAENKSFNDTMTPLVAKYQHLGETYDNIDSVTQESLGTESQQNAEIESGASTPTTPTGGQGGGTTIINQAAPVSSVPQQSVAELYEAFLAGQRQGGVPPGAGGVPPGARGQQAQLAPVAGAARPAAQASKPDFQTSPQQVPVTPEGAQVPTPEMVQQAIPVAAQLIQTATPDETISAHLAGAGYTTPQIQSIIAAARQNFNQLEGTAVKAQRMQQANAGKGQPPIQAGNQPIHQTPRSAGQSANPLQGIVDMFNRGTQNTMQPPANANIAPQQSQYAQQVLATVLKLPPQQRAQFIARQQPQLRAFLIAQTQGK